MLPKLLKLCQERMYKSLDGWACFGKSRTVKLDTAQWMTGKRGASGDVGRVTKIVTH